MLNCKANQYLLINNRIAMSKIIKAKVTLIIISLTLFMLSGHVKRRLVNRYCLLI